MTFIDNNSTILAYGNITGQIDAIFPILPWSPTGGATGPTGPTGERQNYAPTGPAGIGTTGPQLPQTTGPTGPFGIGFPDNGAALLTINNYTDSTNQTIQLFSGTNLTVFTDLYGWFIYEGGVLFADFINKPNYFVVVANFVVSCTSGAIEEVFAEIGINFVDFFTFGAQKYPTGSNPASVMLNCCKVFILDGFDSLSFWLTTTGCSATECTISGNVNVFPLQKV